MSSNINPNNIDGTYPVAGQDNNSQGFRDNFTNTKTNFQYAKDEINDLQAKVVLKAALSGTSLNNDMDGSILSSAQIQDFSASRVSLGTTTGSTGINYAAGHYQTVSIGSIGSSANAISLAFTNFPAAGTQAWVIVRVTVNAIGQTMQLPASVGGGASAASVIGIEGFLNNVITFAQTGTYEFEFHTEDGGSTIYLSELTRSRNYWTSPLTVNSREDLATATAASLIRHASYFSTSAAETATLAAGAEGQIKVFAMYADLGDMVITVSNAGWKSSGTGTITFSAIGQACTLQYINSKWFCIGNNGAVFA
jgi:hypothetical protein